MRFLVPAFVFITVAAFHTAHAASLESAEKEEGVVLYDGFTELQKIDQMEFEAAQKTEAAQMNDTEQKNEETRYIEAVHGETEEEHVEAEAEGTAEPGGGSDAAAHTVTTGSESESSEEAEGGQRQNHLEAETATASSLDEVSQNSTKEQDVLE